MSDQKKTYLITNALPYANGPIHLGHMLEHIQSDIYVRFLRATGHTAYYVCGDDCHGTPVMIKAHQRNITPEQLIEEARSSHIDDLKGFLVEYDNFYTTHSPENRTISEEMYRRAREAGYITTRTISQLYDPVQGMFLPDRFVKGTCPRCGALEQYGDNCEVCGATYAPTELKDPHSAVSGATPELRDSLHYFFDLPKAEEFLHNFIRNSDVLPRDMSHKLEEWFKQGLKPWDISRDAPYFGFKIPDTADKYFYVWMDAPIGYLASFKHYCDRHGIDYERFVKPDTDTLMYHFIGKDILYFHSLFWPATLMAAGMRLPSKILVHGYVTVNGEKMSKSKGTFIKAATFRKYQRPESLRYYFASKLNGQVVDVDLSLGDYMARVNSDIVGKLVNLASRTAGFINSRFDGRLAPEAGSAELAGALKDACKPITAAYATCNYAEAVRQIMALADEANRYIAAHAPWELARQSGREAELQRVCTDGLNAFRALMAYLQPVMPELARDAGAFLNDSLPFDAAAQPLFDHVINKFHPLYQRIEQTQIDAMIEASKEDLKSAAAPAGAAGNKAATHEAPAPETEPLCPEISLDEFAKVDLRVGTITAAELVPEARKLLKLTVDLGFATRQVFAGIKQAYPEPEALLGRKVIVVANLKPRKMKFGLSEGMITAAGPGGEQVFLLGVDSGAQNGDRVH